MPPKALARLCNKLKLADSKLPAGSNCTPNARCTASSMCYGMFKDLQLASPTVCPLHLPNVPVHGSDERLQLLLTPQHLGADLGSKLSGCLDEW